jgi:hypothetical protein
MNEKEFQDLTQPQSYGYWLKQSLMLPLRKDFDGLGEALMDVGRVMFTMTLRLFVFLTLPISAPVLAYILVVANRKVAAKNKAAIERAMELAKPLSRRNPS